MGQTVIKGLGKSSPRGPTLQLVVHFHYVYMPHRYQIPQEVLQSFGRETKNPPRPSRGDACRTGLGDHEPSLPAWRT